MIPFEEKDVYYWQMNGLYSLKNVLPALIPEMSYEGMEVSDGEMAADTWLQIWKLKDPAEIEEKRNSLLEYCKLDTMATVKVLEKLRDLSLSKTVTGQ